MLAHTKKHRTNRNRHILRMSYRGQIYNFPAEVAEQYRVDPTKSVAPEEVFANLNQKYSKPGALLRGIRIRENITQIEMAKSLKVTQSDISQMECGTRKIGRVMAKRIEKLYGTNYRAFLD